MPRTPLTPHFFPTRRKIVAQQAVINRTVLSINLPVRLAPTGDIAGKLMDMISESEDARLARNEARSSPGLASFVEVGEALSDIRVARLYRATHGTFEEYCGQRWGMSRVRAHPLIAGAAVALAMANKDAITSERQARELARVEPARREEVVRKADIAAGGKNLAGSNPAVGMPLAENARQPPVDDFNLRFFPPSANQRVRVPWLTPRTNAPRLRFARFHTSRATGRALGPR